MNFGPLTVETCWRVWGTPANLNRFRVLASLLHRCRSTEVKKTLQDVWPSPGLVHFIYTLGAVAPNGILPPAKFTLRTSFTFSYIGSVTARHSSSGRQPNFVVCTRNGITELSQRAPSRFGWAAITLGSGPHSSCPHSSSLNLGLWSAGGTSISRGGRVPLRAPWLLSCCMTLQQRPSAKLCGVVQGMELRNFVRGCHLYSAGWPSRWPSATF